MIPGPYSERAIILAPHGRDGPLAAQILTEAGFPAKTCASLPALTAELGEGAGLAIVADEAIHGADLRPLASFLESQPPWSDLPIILLTHHGGGPERNPAAARLAEILGNATFLERPFHPTTLVSMVRAAVRSRRRQYEARARLEDLIESEQRLQMALQAGQFGTWTFTVETMELSMSTRCLAQFGRKPGAAFSYDDLRQAVHPEDRVRVQAALEHALSAGGDHAIEYRIVWPDGSVHWLDRRSRAVKDGRGAVTHFVGVCSDITGRKTLELERERLLADLAGERARLSDLTQTLEQRVQERTAELMKETAARERAQEQLFQSQRVESMGHLAGGIAHDFNNLLAAVIGNLELARKRIPEDAAVRRLIDGALRGAERGASLSRRMLAFARQQEMKSAPTDVAALLDGMHDLLDRSLGPRVALHVRVSPNLPAAQIDANQVELAILNLAINAADAMPEGGAIDITVDQQRGGPAQKLAAGPYVRIQVADTGIGMDPATLKKAIEPFFSTKPLGKGTGLGLSMVHGVAVQLGGQLELSSEVGKGTVATLWFPAATASAVAAVRPAASDARAGASATILVVDDDPLVAMSTVGMLEDLGHRVIEANSAQRALEILETGQDFDLLLTDQAMPGMTGVELAKIVRRKRPHLPVLLTTGYGDFPAGQVSTLPRLSKPYRQGQLQAEIERLLN